MRNKGLIYIYVSKKLNGKKKTYLGPNDASFGPPCFSLTLQLNENGPPTRVCSEGGPYGWERLHRLAFGARVGSERVNTAHRLAFVARVGPFV